MTRSDSTRIKINRYARTIKVAGGDEVYTRYSKREYEKRRELFEDSDWNQPTHLADYSYDEWTEWGSQGGRPTKWQSDAERMKYKRTQRKLEQGRPLNLAERKLLGLVKSRPGSYRSELGRAMTSAERKARWRQKHGR